MTENVLGDYVPDDEIDQILFTSKEDLHFLNVTPSVCQLP